MFIPSCACTEVKIISVNDFPWFKPGVSKPFRRCIYFKCAGSFSIIQGHLNTVKWRSHTGRTPTEGLCLELEFSVPWQNTGKGWIVNILGFAGCKDSVATTHPAIAGQKQPWQIKKEKGKKKKKTQSGVAVFQ